jgi:transcriptional regulator with XRE-family HTH domain
MHYTSSMMGLQEIIQREARRQGLSGYRIAKLSGVAMRTVQAYLAGDTDLAGRRIEKIAVVLGLELRPKRRLRKKG